MKYYIFLFLSTLFLSCSHDDIQADKLTFEYLPQQPTILNIEVVPLDGVKVHFDDMLKEVNADYYNRYGIGVKMVLKDRQDLSDKVKTNKEIFLPQHISKDEKKVITVYIMPKQYLYFDAYGYAVIQSKSVILREDAQKSRTLAHEIGHILGLEHSNEYNNVMTPYNIANQYDIPNDFNAMQIDTVLNTVNSYDMGLTARANEIIVID